MDKKVDLLSYLESVKADVLEEIRSIVPADSARTAGIYELMMDYPMRDGKALRPALSVAVCRALGGKKQSVLPTAAVLELYHNAFLIHDDIEDGSDIRRSKPTLHQLHGVPTAVNVGDGMLAITIPPLLDNTERIGLGGALKILRIVSDMARISAEGQMTELNWIRNNTWNHADKDYIRMVHKKTGWYSFIAPAMVGAIAAGLPDRDVALLGRLFTPLGIAFQIKDDLLNLTSNESSYEKDWSGDLWEGKHTLILIHALRTTTAEKRQRAIEVLAKPRPPAKNTEVADPENVVALLNQLRESGQITHDAHAKIQHALSQQNKGESQAYRNEDDITFLKNTISECGSLTYSERVAQRHARKFQDGLARFLANRPDSFHSEFLREIAAFAVERTR